LIKIEAGATALYIRCSYRHKMSWLSNALFTVLALLCLTINTVALDLQLEPHTRLRFEIESEGTPRLHGKTHSAATARMALTCGVTALGQRSDGNWLMEFDVEDAYYVTPVGSKGEASDLAEELTIPFYFLQSADGKIVGVSSNEEEEPSIYELKKRIIGLLHLSLPPNEELEDGADTWYHAEETETRGDVTASYLAFKNGYSGLLDLQRTAAVKHAELATSTSLESYKVYPNNGTIHSASGSLDIIMDPSPEYPDAQKRTLHEVSWTLRTLGSRKIDDASISDASRKLLSEESLEVEFVSPAGNHDHREDNSDSEFIRELNEEGAESIEALLACHEDPELEVHMARHTECATAMSRHIKYHPETLGEIRKIVFSPALLQRLRSYGHGEDLTIQHLVSALAMSNTVEAESLLLEMARDHHYRFTLVPDKSMPYSQFILEFIGMSELPFSSDHVETALGFADRVMESGDDGKEHETRWASLKILAKYANQMQHEHGPYFEGSVSPVDCQENMSPECMLLQISMVLEQHIESALERDGYWGEYYS
jgi:hypothetical protein